MRIIALIDDADVVECILTHLKVWDPIPDPISPVGADPPWPDGETLPLSYHPVPDIACAPVWTPALGSVTPKTAEFMSPSNDCARVTYKPFLLWMRRSRFPRGRLSDSSCHRPEFDRIARRLECLKHIRSKILNTLDADRQADQVL